MFRRRIFRRPRLLGAALVGGLGFAAGRASKQVPDPEVTAKLKELSDLHASGALSDEEFAAAKKQLLGS
jgi:hypothetical protein